MQPLTPAQGFQSQKIELLTKLSELLRQLNWQLMLIYFALPMVFQAEFVKFLFLMWYS